MKSSASQRRPAPAGMAVLGARGACASDPMQDMVALTLDDRGMIRDCNSAGEALFKYRRSELLQQHVSMLLPQLAQLELIEQGQINQHLRFHCRIGRRFQALTRDGKRFVSDLFFNFLHGGGDARLLLLVRPAQAE